MVIVIREHSGKKYIEVTVGELGKAPTVTLGYGDGEGDVALKRHHRFPGGWIVEIEWPEGMPAEKVVPKVYQETVGAGTSAK